MKKIILISLLFFFSSNSFAQSLSGFFNFTIDGSKVKLQVPKDRLGEEFIYINSLSAGVGSNDIGLDRGQLGNTRIVHFKKVGEKLFLVQANQDFIARSNNPAEVQSMKEAFASSILGSFLFTEEGSDYVIDLNSFLIQDSHGVSARLNRSKQGSYSLDKSRSGINIERTKNFPDNTEFDIFITLKGRATGEEIRSVTPSPDVVSVQQHHSFVRLPDSNYSPRKFHPESGFNMTSFKDYALPINEDLTVRFINRHRLIKKNPGSAISEAVEPIIYYLDQGCPEPVKSALLDGAAWWNQAFEAAGFKDGFQVKILPDDADPMDVRYNVIQWVHRSTRGWSYGASVTDPRTGEIIKGHVSLGSLRVRQDFMIAQGIISSFKDGKEDPRMLEMALARLRQLSAHEVGHTIGLAHNFASSVNDRASVMDYPHPFIQMAAGGAYDFSASYDTKIGAWDKRSIIYGYSEKDLTITEAEHLKRILAKNKEMGLHFISDRDARPQGGLHPHAHLWDNGRDPTKELRRICEMRSKVLDNFGASSIAEGRPYSEVENVLVPAYLMHRYQVEAAVKKIGGVLYSYAVKEDGRNADMQAVSEEEQILALDEILETLDPDFLHLSDEIVETMPPPAFGYSRTRESFKGHTGLLFDPIAAAEASANHSISLLLNAERLSRIHQMDQKELNLSSYLDRITNAIYKKKSKRLAIQLMLEKLYYIHLVKLSSNTKIDKQVAAMANFKLTSLDQLLKADINSADDDRAAHAMYLIQLASNYKLDPKQFPLPEIPQMPPGSPIGCY